MIVYKNPINGITTNTVNTVNTTCLICLEDQPFPEFENFPCQCNGPFHKECLDTWFTTQNNPKQCPLCRIPIYGVLPIHDFLHNIGNFQWNLQYIVVLVTLSLSIFLISTMVALIIKYT
jgi:hypothetical protein